MEDRTRRIGVVSIIIHDRKASAMQVNEILSRHGEIIIGRMGIPYQPRGISIIALIINGTTDEVGSLTGQLGNLSGVEVKSALTKA
ncbi:MAG TPA: iron-only hydrogenase system regulator [Deltaproteobacteria bacterium]|jgi:putative iron-only hydrogenase system regulator|nr:iron-only hydrogenase system regulator [Deltaproteobacteria bacterium]HQI02015.1 iron-only hydrogenase system regulator [Deltaproteobacteria bacterium]HQJ07871.1 iron-only hydrogenase system regulator [Deltaproteobacteria bacterium]